MAMFGLIKGEETFREVTTAFGSSAVVLSTHFEEARSAYEATSEVLPTSDEGK